MKVKPPPMPRGVAPVRVPPAVRSVQLVLGVAVVVYLASIFTRGAAAYSLIYDGWVTNVALLLCPLLCGLRAWRDQSNRLAFALLGCGCLLYALGNIVYVAYVPYQDPQPYPTFADIGYLGAYPFIIAAVLLLAHADVGTRQLGVWLDGVVGVFGVAAVGAAVVVHTALSGLSGTLALIVGVSFPLGDVMLLCVIVGVLTLNGDRPGRRWTTLAVGLSVFAVGDMIYLVRLGTDSYKQGTLLDASWVLGLTIVAMAAWQPAPRRSAVRTSGALTLVVTVTFSLVALGVLVGASRYQIGWDAVSLAAATLLAGLLRTVVAFHQVRQLAELRQQAVTDDLTGLPNRRAFTSAVEDALVSGGNEPGLAVLHIDLDRFKEINDLFGHHAGDRLLRQIGPRLATALRPGDFLARIDGDAFGLLLAGVDETMALRIAGLVRDTLVTPFVLGDDVQQVAGSVGLALWPAHADNALGLIQCADIAMHSAKIHRGDVGVYDPVHGAAGRNRLALARELRPALEAGQFVVHYQAKFDIRSGAVVGVEALVRWQHPRLGLLYPDAFLPIAEQTGSLGLLTEIVLASSLAQGVRWRHDGLDLGVAVNLSASSLSDAGLVATIAAALATKGFPADRLTLEITESALMTDREGALATLGAIRDLGITLSVDDYGTGFSSLTYLRDLPVQELKIDRTFVIHVAEDRSDAAIVKSTIDLAHSLGLTVVAEGVEDSLALAMLDEYGCDVAQGYYLGRPVPACELSAVLIAGRTRTQPSYAHA